MEGQIAQISAEPHHLVMANPTSAHRFGIMLSIPRTGPVAGIAMIVEVPGLGRLDAMEATNLASLSPAMCESGK